MTHHPIPVGTSCVLDALRASGELVGPGRGTVGLSGRPLRLLRALDEEFLSWAADLGSEEWRFPAMLRRDTLERAGFFPSFAHLGTSAIPLDDQGAEAQEEMLSTAVCFHLYPLFVGRLLPAAEPTLLTAAGECYRFEGSEMEPLRRQWAFTMREIVILGSAAAVEEQRRALMQRALDFARGLGLAASVAVATDPFFTSEGRGRALLQRVKELKYELSAATTEGDLAVASFNNHEDFFGKAFDFQLLDGTPGYSGCVAFGLERWVYALMDRHGIEFQL